MMDAEAFALTRNVQLKQLVESVPRAGVDIAQANWILESLVEDSPTPYLAAVILLLKTAVPEAVAAACSHMTDRTALLAFARHAAETNNSQALLFFDRTAHTTPSRLTSPDYSQGAGTTAHGGVLLMSPVVENQVFDNGGICLEVLSYPEEEAEEVVEKVQTGFQTDNSVVGTKTLDNLAPPPEFAKAWAKDMKLGKHINKIISGYISKITKNGFEFKAHADLKAGDLDSLMSRLPLPDVQGKAFDLAKYTKHKHPVGPTGLDLDEMAEHKIPAASLKDSDELAKVQQKVRERTVKLLLPANECAMQLFEHTAPQDTPTALKEWILNAYPSTECEEGTQDERPEAEKFEGSVRVYINTLHEALYALTDRLTLASHAGFLEDYDLQMQRVKLVAPQTPAVANEAFGRGSASTFVPHSTVPADRMKSVKHRPVTAETIAQALWQQKDKTNDRKRPNADFLGKGSLQSRAGKLKGGGKNPSPTAALSPVPGSKTPPQGQGGAAASGKNFAKGKGNKNPSPGSKKSPGGGHPAAEE